jgi:hypothetical protein
MRKILILLLIVLSVTGIQCLRKKSVNCEKQQISPITMEMTEEIINELAASRGASEKDRIVRGVTQAAALWREEDGSDSVFRTFCIENYAAGDKARSLLFTKISGNLEALWGNFNRISIDLKRALHLDRGELIPVDEMFGAYDPFAHLNDDFFSNKIAFVTLLNFPCYTLEEKEKLGESWSREQWAWARLGDVFSSRVPSAVLQEIARAATESDTYISAYNIHMDKLRDDKGRSLFPEGMKLISHWGLRDELKSHYADPAALEKQQMIYKVMERIITQEIPAEVINNPELTWNPYSNKVMRNNTAVDAVPEPDTRYAMLLGNFNALKEADVYSPSYPTYISRKFEQEMEMPMEEVEKLFVDFISSPLTKEVAALISKRLNRKLQPFDIWYDGFKPRSNIAQQQLDVLVSKRYPDATAFEKELPLLLQKLQFSKEKSLEICSRIAVEPSRGAGHAWGAMMRGDKALLRTRVADNGMNYKGYNIAIHEFGHNVEQTLSLYDVDYYTMNGVPNTAFTEALAFIFQKRDLDLLGIRADDPLKQHYLALDNFWSSYEIMGVSLVDMYVWKWMYEHPDATPAELKVAVLGIARDVWNKYYADVFQVKDSPVLAIYSHMIDAPLYLSAYPVGHLIEFQMEKHLEGKNFAAEVIRIYTQGRLTPGFWMKAATGNNLSAEPMLKAASEAVAAVK